jgi:hypothetical protein
MQAELEQAAAPEPDEVSEEVKEAVRRVRALLAAFMEKTHSEIGSAETSIQPEKIERV